MIHIPIAKKFSTDNQIKTTPIHEAKHGSKQLKFFLSSNLASF